MLFASKVVPSIGGYFTKVRLSWFEQKLCTYSKNQLPEPPKKPLTAFLLFCKEERPTVRKEKLGLSVPQLTKVLAEKWKSLAPDAKKIYEEVSREETVVYGQKYKQYYEALTEDEKAELIRVKAEKREARRLSRLKKELRLSGMPKIPGSAYALFVKEKAQEWKGKKEATFSEFTKSVAAQWNTMSEEDKQPYVDQSKSNKELYLMQLKEWRKQLVQKGQSNILQMFDERKIRGKKTTIGKTSSPNKPT